MSLEELVSKYISSAEYAYSRVKVTGDTLNFDGENVRKVLALAKTYLEDAKYYRDKSRLEVSLASIAYCEGLLDALKLLGAVIFEWPLKAERDGK